MMGLMQGTRQRQTFKNEPVSEKRFTESLTRDPGLSKLVTASITFVADPTHQLQAANGTFANFAVGDVILIQGTLSNDHLQTVTAIDGTNQAFLTVSPGPKTEGPITATVRTL